MTTDRTWAAAAAAAPDIRAAGAAPAGRAADGVDLDAVFGVLQLGDALAALSVEVLREVIPCPRELSALPASTTGLLGAVSVRGQVVPVVDLRIVLGQAGGRQPDQVVVLMRHDGRLLGLLANGVRGLTRLPPAGLSTMDVHAGRDGDEGHALLFSGSFEREDDASVVSLLDPAALMRLPGLPLLRDRPTASVAGVNPTPRRGTAAEQRPLLLVRCGTVSLAIEVTDVHATLPRVTLLASSLDGATCRGVIDYAGVRLPAVDPLALMQLGALPDGEPCQALLLRYPAGQVALLVSEVIDIVRVPAADLLPVPLLAVCRPALFSATLRVDGRGEHLVLAAGALLEEPALLALATLNTRTVNAANAANPPAGRASAAGEPRRVVGEETAGSASDGDGSGGRNGIAVITYDVGAEVATRLAQVNEVLPFPRDAARPASAHPAVAGMVTCRGRSVTLLCLTTLLRGRAAAFGPDARVLMVQVDGAHFGFVVPKLCHIDNTLWEQPPGRPERERSGATSLLGQHALVEIGAATRRRTVHLVDLRAVARGLMEGAGVRAPLPMTAKAAAAVTALASSSTAVASALAATASVPTAAASARVAAASPPTAAAPAPAAPAASHAPAAPFPGGVPAEPAASDAAHPSAPASVAAAPVRNDFEPVLEPV